MKIRLIIWRLLFGCLVMYIPSYTSAQNKTAATGMPASFLLPEIPVTLTSPEDRAAYLAIHYWDKFNFRDTTLISKPEITEQAFVDFINILFYVKDPSSGINRMFDLLNANNLMFVHFRDMAEKYLYDPNSPMRNEELYIPVLEYVVGSDKVSEYEKVRPRYRLEMARKNRPGMQAIDFTYTLADGRSAEMSDIKADYTILFFNNPDCHDCQRVKDYMLTSPVITSMRKKGSNNSTEQAVLAILAVYIDGDIPLWRSAKYPKFMINSYDAAQIIENDRLYDLKAIPTLYLLDKDKKVILKDAAIEDIELWLGNKAMN